MSLKEQLRVMVVDDMATSRGLILNALNEMGVKNVVYESSGDAGFQKLGSTPVHLIISDHNMPGMSGLEFLRAVRSHQATARTGFILITGSPDPQLVQTGIQLGLNNFIKKPFSTVQLKQCIEKVVGRL